MDSIFNVRLDSSNFNSLKEVELFLFNIDEDKLIHESHIVGNDILIIYIN